MVRRAKDERDESAASSTSALAAPANAAPAIVDSERLLGSVVRSLRSFPPDVVDRGRALLRGVDDPIWDRRRRRLTVPVRSEGRGGYQETVSLEVSPGGELANGLRCTCAGPRSPGECEHAHAALYHLYSLLSMAPDALRLEIADDSASGDLDAEDSTAEERWLEDLDSFDRLLAGFGAPREKNPAARVPNRLSWRVRRDDGPRGVTFTVEPWEEKPLARGGYGAARSVPWRRYVASPELWSSSAERTIAALVRHSSLDGGGRFSSVSGFAVDAFDLLDQLVDNRRVLEDEPPHSRVKVERADVGATLEIDDAGRLHLVATLGGLPLAKTSRFRLYARGIVLDDSERNRILTAPLSGARYALVEHMTRDGLSVPPSAHDALLARLPTIESLLPVTVPPEIEGETVPADGRLRALFRPNGPAGALRLALRVRPFGDDADRIPGAAPERAYRFAEGRCLSAYRDLEREAKTAALVAEQLGLARDDAGDAWIWELDSAEAALEVLSRLRCDAHGDLEDQIVIEWPEGGELALLPKRAEPGALRVSIDDAGELFSVKGSLELDDERVALALLLDRVEAGNRFVQSDTGRFVEISDELFERLQTLARLARSTPKCGRGVDRVSLPAVEDALEGVDVECSASWEDLRRRFRDAARRIPDSPRGFRAELRDYQTDGFRWMLRLSHLRIGACLADDMGLGKTLQTLAVLVERAAHGPALVVAPTSVSDNWIAEAKRFAPSLSGILYRDTDRRGSARMFQRGDLVITSYGLLRRDLDRLRAQRWGTVVLDEAQSIKNSRSLVAKAARELDARWKVALTGTPVENHLGELWSIFQFLSPELLGSWESFKRGFAVPIEKEHDDVASTRLAHLTRPFILRRTKSEVLAELPPRTDITLHVELSPEERRLYENARLAALARLAKRDAAGTRDLRFDVLAALTRLRQLACHPRLANPESTVSSSKLAILADTLETLRSEGHRALVFSQFTSHLALIREELDRRKIQYLTLDGQTPAPERARRVESFQNGEADVFLISLMAGGTGLNLTAADYVIHADPWWNPAVEDQATDRAHRMGQERPVTVYRLVTSDTVEEEIHRLQEHKRGLLAKVLDGADLAGKVSTEELVRLIRIGLDAREDAEEAAAETG